MWILVDAGNGPVDTPKFFAEDRSSGMVRNPLNVGGQRDGGRGGKEKESGKAPNPIPTPVLAGSGSMGIRAAFL
jgi:hypothetical protein